MLLKKNRASTKAIEKIFKEGKFINSSILTFKFILSSNTHEPKLSIIAPKSLAKTAVLRNHLRRAGYTALGRHIGGFPLGITGAFVFKRKEDDISILENEVKTILNKVH
ncbi:MAG: ribonuclease P protein component [bacterium]